MRFDDLAPENDKEDEEIIEVEYEAMYKGVDDLLLAYNYYSEEYILYHEMEISDGETIEVYCVKVFESKKLTECVDYIRNFYERKEDW